MSETLHDLVVSLSLQTDNFTRNIKSVNNQIKEAESAFRLASAGVDNFDHTTAGISARLTMLQRKLKLQGDAVTQYRCALQAADDKILECTHRQQDYANRLTVARTAHAALKTQIQASVHQVRTMTNALGANDSATIAARANLDLLKEEYRRSAQNVRKLAGQNTALKKSTQNAADAYTQVNTNLKNAEAEMKLTNAQIKECSRQLKLSQTQWDAAAKTIENSLSALATLGKQLHLAESRFKLAAAGVKDFDHSAAGLTAKLTLLKQQVGLQSREVDEYKKSLKAALLQLKAAKEAHDPDKIKEASDAIIEARTALNLAEAQLKKTRAEIRQTEKDLAAARSAWTTAGQKLEAFAKTCESVSRKMVDAGRVLSRVMTTPILGLGAASVKASISFESAFTSVRKTVEASESEFSALSDEIKEMSTVVASSANDIAEVVAVAGQLGIANEYLSDFARTMIDLGNSTDIVASDAASTLARFANITNMDQGLFHNLGSALVDLGNNYATTESSIMEMSLRLAGAGHQVGLSEAQILGFAAALSSVGIEAQMGGSAFSKALIKMEVAAATGGQALEDFGRVSGMSGEAFQQLFERDAAKAFQAFIVGLSKMDDEGISAIATLEEIGIKEVRLRDTLLRAVNATELFEKTQKTANEAWEENTALTEEAEKRYATTESQLINLKNKAVLFGQTIGDDLNPVIHDWIDGADELLDCLMNLDEAQRAQILNIAGIAAAAGPVLLLTGKVTHGVGELASGIGKFASAVGRAGGGFRGFVSVLGHSPAVWLAVAAAAVTATVAIADYASGARQAREALKGMEETARNWKETAAETFYGKSEGLSFFGLSKDAFSRDTQGAGQWLQGVIDEWHDGEKETDEIVAHWVNSFQIMTSSTRTQLESLKNTADASGYTNVSQGLEEDIKKLDSIDAEVASLLKKCKNGSLTEQDQIRLQELIDTREEIEIKYNLSPADTDGFETIQQKIDAEIARAHARGEEGPDTTVYENAMVAAAEGLAVANSEIYAQYDKEYGLIQLIEDAGERQQALDELNAKYNTDRRNAALEYAELLAGITMPVWEQPEIQQASTDMDTLMQKLREYSTAGEADKPAILEEMNALTEGMDEGALAEYMGLLTQIQSLMDSGMTEEEVQALFPEIDFTGALEQIAAIQEFIKNHKTELPGLVSMFGEALPEGLVTITADLDMTQAQARWDTFAANPGAITTEAIISELKEDESTVRIEPRVEAFISKYTEIPEGASTAELTPEGIVAYVKSYSEMTTGADVSGLTPENVTAMVSAYQELAEGTDISALKPDEVSAYVSQYLQEQEVDTTGLSPEGITAFVVAYEEATGGALTTALTPDGITAMVAGYLEAENIDISKLSPDQVEAIVSRFAEAVDCDKSGLLQNFTAYITRYDDTNAEKPQIEMKVGIYGYDLLAYRQFIQDHPVEVQGIVKLGEVYDTPEASLTDPNTKFWQGGQEVPVEAVPQELLTPDKVAVLDADGTLHVLITPEVSGSEEVITELRTEIDESNQLGTSAAGSAAGILPMTMIDMIDSAIERIHTFNEEKGTFAQWLQGGESGAKNVLDQSMHFDFNPENVAQLSTYVSELVSAILQGKEVREEDLTNLQTIVDFLNALDTTQTGTHVLEGIGVGMTEAGWAADAETVASNLEAALNLALGIQSPSTRVKPVGGFVSAGVGVGMSEYSFSPDANAMAGNLHNAIQTALPPTAFTVMGIAASMGLASAMTGFSFSAAGASVGGAVRSSTAAHLNEGTLRPLGLAAMNGLKSGIEQGRSRVVSAMKDAARAAVRAAKDELEIRSPSRVFKNEVGVMSMKGFGEGIREETAEQVKIIRNASRYLTRSAQDGAIVTQNSDNRRTYDQSVRSTVQVQQLVVRDSQDVRELAVEIAALTRRRQRGKGMRNA